MNNVKIKSIIINRAMTIDGLDGKQLTLSNNFDGDTSKLWCRLTIQHGINQMVGMAKKPMMRESGAIVFQIFTPKNTLELEADKMVDAISNHFAYYQHEFFECLTPSVVNASDDDFNQINVRIPFRYN